MVTSNQWPVDVFGDGRYLVVDQNSIESQSKYKREMNGAFLIKPQTSITIISLHCNLAVTGTMKQHDGSCAFQFNVGLFVSF